MYYQRFIISTTEQKIPYSKGIETLVEFYLVKSLINLIHPYISVHYRLETVNENRSFIENLKL